MSYLNACFRSCFFISSFFVIQQGFGYPTPNTTAAVAWMSFMFFDCLAQLSVDVVSGYLKLRASEKNADIHIANKMR